jgi:hypothetical protein
VLGAAFEVKGLGSLQDWSMRHKLEVVTFHTLKLREAKDGQKERSERKRRKHTRRNVAHGLRIARFEQRTAQGRTA